MAVVQYNCRVGLGTGTGNIGPKEMPAPKEASVRAWWNACRKGPLRELELPVWGRAVGVSVHVTTEVIHFSWERGDIFISRRGRLR